jgi:putative flavoprotein involved in K+ transport
MTPIDPEPFGTVVVGGGQAGLAVGYHLARRDLPFVILDANRRVGDAWRNRWDSLRLFTPARYDGLEGMPFPAPPGHFPTKDEVADYLEAYAREFDLPVRTGVKVDALRRKNGHFLVTAGDHRFEADNVVVAMSGWQTPRIPAGSAELSPDILQLRSTEYRNPGQLQEGDVLVVGAGNSGAEIAIDVAAEHRTLLSGPGTGHVPIRLEGLSGRLAVPIVQRFIFHRLLTTSTPLGRKARPKLLSHGEPWVRVKLKQLAAAGVERVPRMVGASGGLPMLEDNQVVDAANVIWCTGFEPSFSWIDLPVFGEKWPNHDRGVVTDEPGLYFVGLKFLYSVSSALIHGVGRDAARIADAIAARDIEAAEAADHSSVG